MKCFFPEYLDERSVDDNPVEEDGDESEVRSDDDPSREDLVELPTVWPRRRLYSVFRNSHDCSCGSRERDNVVFDFNLLGVFYFQISFSFHN